MHIENVERQLDVLGAGLRLAIFVAFHPYHIFCS